MYRSLLMLVLLGLCLMTFMGPSSAKATSIQYTPYCGGCPDWGSSFNYCDSGMAYNMSNSFCTYNLAISGPLCTCTGDVTPLYTLC